MSLEHPGSRGGEPTLALKVDNMSFLLEQLGRDCAPDQLVRELTVNAIQAIQATGEGGEVVWRRDERYSAEFGADKLAVIDTGTGMTGPEMVRYINHLASSGRVQSEEGNFGVGAKIAAATRNPLGMVYLSWKDGRGAMTWFWKNPETGEYGLKRLPRGDGSWDFWVPVPDSLRPDPIRTHGTMVVLLGREPLDSTLVPPDAEAGRDGAAPDGSDPWLARYLNGRFFAFDQDIRVRAPAAGGHGTRPVHGMRHLLALVSTAAGSVDLGGATAHWWILPEQVPGAELDGAYHASGHVGALFQGEVYELYGGRAGTAKLQSFGVAVGHHRVVLYVEPATRGHRRVVANTARTALLMDGRPLPWAEWAESFRANLPAEILELMEEVAGVRDARSRTESFKERMKSLASLIFIGDGDDRLFQLFAPERTRRTRDPRPERALQAVPAETPAESAPEPRDAPAPRDGASEPGTPPSIDLDRLLELEVVWVTAAECGVVDRAGHYIPETNTLLVNRDFRVFADYVARWRAKYEGNPGAQREVEELVREWLEQPLRELIIRSHFLRGSEGWSDEHVATLLSDEALTAVSLPCYLTEMRLRTAVSQHLGKLPASRAA